MTPEHLRELLQAFALGTVLALQAFEVSADLSQLQFQFGVTTACMRYKNTNKKKKNTCSETARQTGNSIKILHQYTPN